MSEYIFDGPDLDGELRPRGRDQGRCKTPCKTQVSPSRQIIVWPKLSVVLRLGKVGFIIKTHGSKEVICKLSVKNQTADIFL